MKGIIMSNYEWATGHITLPAADLATIKREFRNRHNSLIEKAYDELKRFRSANLTSSKSRWQAAIETTDDPTSRKMTIPLRIAMRVARSLERPRAVKWTDFNLELYSRAPVTEKLFPLFDARGNHAGNVLFVGRRMTWTIFEENYAVDIFADSPDAKFLYETILKGIFWNRGSGGGETYHSEKFEDPIVSYRFGSLGKNYEPSLQPELSRQGELTEEAV